MTSSSPWRSETTEDLLELLSACPAFTGVELARLERLAAAAEIAYLPTAAPVPGDAYRTLVVQRGALLVTGPSGATVDLVARGEFWAPAERHRLEPVEDSLVVLLPDEAVDLAWSAPHDKLRPPPLRPSRSEMELETAPLRTVMSSRLITVDADDTCRAAAQLMGRHKISSLVVVGRDEPGIVTDRDLSNRLVARGGSSEDPVSAVATFPVRTIPADTPVFEALIEMLATGIHHLPVTDGHGIAGMVSAGDLLQLRTRNPLFLRKSIDRAKAVDEVADAVGGLPATVESLLAAGTTAGDVGRVLATVTDRVVRRLLTLSTVELGEPPAAYGWLAFGSQGRREQSLSTDQDTGLLYPDGLCHGDRDWFGKLGVWMTAALERCGYPRCPGGVMASERRWRRDASGWREAYEQWIRTPTGAHLLGASIGFDLRTVVGSMNAEETLRPVIASSAGNRLFLAHLAGEAVRHRPPLGFRGRLTVDRSGEDAGTFDVKAGALLPITDLARLHTLARGGAEISTDDRLAAAAADGLMSADLASTLREGFEVALRVRLEGHLAQRVDQVPLHNRVDPGTLPPLVRSQLRETFKAVRRAQELVESDYKTGRLG